MTTKSKDYCMTVMEVLTNSGDHIAMYNKYVKSTRLYSWNLHSVIGQLYLN